MFLSLYRDPEARNRRALRKAESTQIGDFVDGSFGKIIGEVIAKGTTLRTPLSGRRCVYYNVSIQAEVRSEDAQGMKWRQLYKDESAQNFLIKDQSGTALVLLDGARVQLAGQDSAVLGTINDFPEEIQHTLLEFSQVAGIAAMGHTLRYIERTLEPEMVVAVMGHGVFQPDPDPTAAPADYRGVANQLVMQGRPGQPLLVSDEPTVTSP